MVSETSLERFMKLQKLQSPKKWAEELKIHLFENELDWMKGRKDHDHYVVSYPFKEISFYDLFDMWEKRGVNYKIYHVLRKDYWVVEVNNERRKE